MKSTPLFGAVVFATLAFTVGCARQAPTAPSEPSVSVGAAPLSDLTDTPVVTLQADLTANPAMVTVTAGNTVLFVNNSNQYVRMRSACTEFLTLALAPGASRHTTPFTPAGKTCDYFVWNWPEKIFVGQVFVQ